MEFGNENDNNVINWPSKREGAGPNGEQKIVKRKLYVGCSPRNNGLHKDASLWWMGEEDGGGRWCEVVGYGGWVKKMEEEDGVRQQRWIRKQARLTSPTRHGWRPSWPKPSTDAAAAARKKREAEAEKQRLLAEKQRQKHAAAAAKAADEKRVRRRETIFREENSLHAQAKDWQRDVESGESVDYGSKVSHLLNRVTDLLATCIAQQEDIYYLDHTSKALHQSLDQTLKRVQPLEQQVANANASADPSYLADLVNVLEIDVGTLKAGTQQHVCAAASSSTTPRETMVKFDGLPIFCDASKTDPIQWWRQFDLKLDLHHVANENRHAYLYSRSGGACQSWLDNMLSAHTCTATELHKYITWADLTVAWKKHFQVELPEHQAMDKLLTFTQHNMPSGDWISEFQRLASMPKLPLNFDGIKLYFIKRSCPALQNALTHVAETLTTSEELFNKVAQIIVTNLAARNMDHSSNAGQGANQHRSSAESGRGRSSNA
ncbi:hypothetical protein CBR_g34127 [Chara braunii]|uniref:Retrotransposon gag domain-containing protein n=1 Tax=Chara braunii TaxID=69332 RepID=A0A388LHZ1_CHABU|nr:hypothetical protein CBR_g34127 [Chara braunii]|eukprot:GBG81944.1 hypothetical protein CBR_g34127 [Chara braunii]